MPATAVRKVMSSSNLVSASIDYPSFSIIFPSTMPAPEKDGTDLRFHQELLDDRSRTVLAFRELL